MVTQLTSLVGTLGYRIGKWVWSVIQLDQLVVAACIRLQLQNMKDESRGMTQTYTVRSDEQSQRSSCTRMVKACEFSNQILLLQATGSEEWGRRWTIRNIFEWMTKAFLESTSRFLRNSLFSAELHVPHNYHFCILMTADAIPKSSSAALSFL